MPKFQKTYLATLIILALATAAVGGIDLWQTFQEQSQPEKTEEKDTSKDMQKVEGTEDWKTYRSEEFGFEIKYPEGWEVEERRETPPWWVTLKPTKNSRSHLQISPLSMGGMNPLNDGSVPKEETVFAGRQAVKHTVTAEKVDPEFRGDYYFAVRIRELSGTVWESENGIFYLVDKDDERLRGVFDQILSTFKFTE